MPTTQADYTKIEEARKRAGALGERALGLQAGAETFSDRVMKDVRSARASRGTSMLAQDIGTTTGQLASEGSAMRERLSGVNPLDVINLTARQRAGTLGTLATQAQAQTGIEGTIQEVIGGGVNQLKSAALLKQAEAQKATEEANTLLEQVQFKEAQTNREFDEWAKRQQISQGWAQVNKPSGGGLQDWLTKAILSKQIGTMTKEVPSSVKTNASEYLSTIKDLSNIKTQLEGAGGEGSWLANIFKGTTGPLSGIGGAYRKGAETRQSLSRLQADVTHGIYGSALTETEMKAGKKWLIDPGRQERTNLVRINDLLQKKQNELTSLLSSQGLDQEQVGQYMTTGQFPEFSMQDIFSEIQSSFGGTEWQDTGNTVER